MTSQTWRSTADVNTPEWHEWVRIVVPTGIVNNTALLLIDGGSYSPTVPAVDSTALQYAQFAVELHTVFIDLQDIPDEPLTFTGDPNDPRSEDAIIAYTYNEFMNNIGQPGNDTWPALLPMVKASVRAMDTVQSFVPTVAPLDSISNFMVTGYSKRGWTTWLTAAVDDRVTAIIPGVFDNLNQGEQMVHQYEVYGFFSPAVQDYNDLNIFGRMETTEGEALSEIVDPYRYLSNGRFATMPKLLINSAGDEFFVSDSAQFYFHDIPGSENYLRYIPNVGHGLDPTDVANSTLSFYAAVVTGEHLPQFSWTVEPDGSINVHTVDTPSQVVMWQATNPTARDFRHAYNPDIVWTSSPLASQGGGIYIGSVPTPATGATAFFVQLEYPSLIPGDPFVFTTEIHVDTNLPLFAWPFESDTLPEGATPATADMNPVAVGLATISPSASGATNTTLTAAVGAQPSARSGLCHDAFGRNRRRFAERFGCVGLAGGDRQCHDRADRRRSNAYNELEVGRSGPRLAVGRPDVNWRLRFGARPPGGVSRWTHVTRKPSKSSSRRSRRRDTSSKRPATWRSSLAPPATSGIIAR